METPTTTRLVLDPAECSGVVFDMDGVLTDTAPVHAGAWKRAFDETLTARGGEAGDAQQPFDVKDDYRRHVDGKPRLDGVRDFLAARGIELDEGEPGDPPERDTLHGIANRKNEYFLEALRRDGVEAFDEAVQLVEDLRQAGIGVAVLSASRNAREVLERCGIADLFAARVDGRVAAEAGLDGKPAPDTLLEAARRLDADPGRCAVFEDARAGVEAGQSAGFRWVVGVARDGEGEELRGSGAGFAVSALDEVDVHPADPVEAPIDGLTAAEDAIDAILERIGSRDPVLLLDFDGTLAPIVERQEDAALEPRLRKRLFELRERHAIAVVSGRDLEDLRERMGLDGIYYAGSHGFELAGPDGWRHEVEGAGRFLAGLDEAEGRLRERLGDEPGVEVERKRYAIAVHYRRAGEGAAERVRSAASAVARETEGLRTGEGRSVVELRPDADWHKGKAVELLLRELDLPPGRYCPIYVGDDVTDEDAFAAVEETGIPILVRGREGTTRARYALEDPAALASLLARLDDETVRR